MLSRRDFTVAVVVAEEVEPVLGGEDVNTRVLQPESYRGHCVRSGRRSVWAGIQPRVVDCIRALVMELVVEFLHLLAPEGFK